MDNKKKKSKKIVVWLLIVCFLAGCVGLGVWFFRSDLKYNLDIRSSYVRVMDNLDDIMAKEWGVYGGLKNRQINSIRFSEPITIENADDKYSIIEILAQGERSNKTQTTLDGFFRVAERFYNALINAEKANDLDAYVQALQECFTTMLGMTYELSDTPLELPLMKEQAEKFNALFNLSTAKTDKNIQNKGFLPQYIKKIEDVEVEGTWCKATFVMKGRSFVEVDGENGLGVIPNKKSNAIMEAYNKDKLQIYETDFTFSIVYDYDRLRGPEEFLDMILDSFLNGHEDRAEFRDITVTRFVSADSALDKMQNKVFRFQRNG